MAENKKLNIYQKLIEVRKSIGKVSKDTKGYGFEYASGNQVLSKIKESMDKQGILLEPHLIDGSVREVTSINKDGRNIINYIVTTQMKMIWVNAEKPEDRSIVDWFMVGEQTDPSQAFGSGLTYTERYFIMKYFNVPTDKDDPDKNKGKDEEIDPFAEEDHTGNGKTEKLVTEPQLKRYFAMAKEAGVDIDILDEQIKKKYGVKHKNELTMSQLDEVFKYLEEEIKKNSQ